MPMRVRFLKREEIEAAALSLLTAYERRFGVVIAPPIPVEEIIECHLELDFGFDDLTRSLGMSHLLGATWVEQRRVRIDETLDPTVFPLQEGRYRFTVSHEVGHWELHRHLFLGNANQASLFDISPQSSVVCRVQSKKEPIEWQADVFSGYLLMPKTMVLSAWTEMHGRLEPYVAVEEIVALSERWSLDTASTPTVEVARKLAKDFEVSGQAMQIRLIDLGLIQTQDKDLNLFSHQGRD